MTPDPKTEALKPTPVTDAFKELRAVVGDSFDKIEDVDAYCHELRHGSTRAPAIERDAEAAAMREALERMVRLYESEYDCEVFHRPEWLRAALASTAGTDFAERLRKAEEERDEARAQLADAEKSSRDRFDQIMEARDQRDAAESARDALAKECAELKRMLNGQ